MKRQLCNVKCVLPRCFESNRRHKTWQIYIFEKTELSYTLISKKLFIENLNHLNWRRWYPQLYTHWQQYVVFCSNRVLPECFRLQPCTSRQIQLWPAGIFVKIIICMISICKYWLLDDGVADCWASVPDWDLRPWRLYDGWLREGVLPQNSTAGHELTVA